jgi:hypothetical protein
MRRVGLRLLVAGLASAVTLAAVPNTALAADQSSGGADAVAAVVADAVEAVGPAAGPADAVPLTPSADGTLVGPELVPDTAVTLSADGPAAELSVPVVPGQAPVAVTLPAGSGAGLAADGTAVMDGTTDGVDLAVHALDNGGARVQAVLADASVSPRIPFTLDLPAGTTVRLLPDGGAVVVGPLPDAPVEPAPPGDVPEPANLPPAVPAPGDTLESPGDDVTRPGSVVGTDEAVLLHIPAPWAVDATGAALPTRYEVAGSTITQVVDTRGASFPVVADPAWIPVIIALTAAAARLAAPVVARAYSVIRLTPGMAPTATGGFATFSAFKTYYGTRAGYHWHHIVEQGYGLTRWSAQTIHNPRNLAQIPGGVHQKCVNSMMSSKNVSIPGYIVSGPYNTLREAINRSGHSYQRIHELGIALLRYCGVQI